MFLAASRVCPSGGQSTRRSQREERRGFKGHQGQQGHQGTGDEILSTFVCFVVQSFLFSFVPFVPFVVRSFSVPCIQLTTESTNSTKNSPGRLIFLSASWRLGERNNISHTEHTAVTEGRAAGLQGTPGQQGHQGRGMRFFLLSCVSWFNLSSFPSCPSCLRGEISFRYRHR